jgi:transposase-like protein
VLLYFKGLSLRAIREFLLHKGYEVSIETIREWFHAVGRALQTIYTTAVWVYVDETKIKAMDRTYYLWLAVDEKGLPVFVHLSKEGKPEFSLFPSTLPVVYLLLTLFSLIAILFFPAQHLHGH